MVYSIYSNTLLSNLKIGPLNRIMIRKNCLQIKKFTQSKSSSDVDEPRSSAEDGPGDGQVPRDTSTHHQTEHVSDGNVEHELEKNEKINKTKI